MRYRAFSGSGFEASEIGLGCWQFGGDWGAVDEPEALATLGAAVDAGINFFDTADVYGAGRSESIIGRFLSERNRREDVFIATKLGRLHGYPDSYSPELFTRCVDDSLERLGVDVLDLVQLHCVPPHWLRQGEVFAWLDDLKAAGKIRHYGASVETMDEALVCLDHPSLSALQIIFNIFRQKPIHAIFERAKKQKVAIIVRLPLASGLLAGRYTTQTTFPQQDHRNYNRDGAMFSVGETFAGLPFETGVALADRVKCLFERAGLMTQGVTMAQLAQRWILDHDAVSTVITGSRRTSQVGDNAAASDLPALPPEIHAELTELYGERVKPEIRGGE